MLGNKLKISAPLRDFIDHLDLYFLYFLRLPFSIRVTAAAAEVLRYNFEAVKHLLATS